MRLTRKNDSKKAGAVLWTIQGLLAALFLFAGGMKLAMPIGTLAAQAHMSGAFLKFIGVCEVLGALGLILPGLLRIRPGLTPLAASGLAIIMIGATVISLPGGAVAALVPFATGVLATLVALGRRTWAARRPASRSAALQPAA
jgi:DoxX-like protein